MTLDDVAGGDFSYRGLIASGSCSSEKLPDVKPDDVAALNALVSFENARSEHF